MTRWTSYTLALALSLGVLQASAELPDTALSGGKISYLNPATLEVGIGNNVYRLDSGFRIHGLGDADRVALLNALEPGMHIRFSTSGPAGTGTIQEIWVRLD